MTTVGVVGLGTMGGAIAARLLDAGYEVHGTNRTPAKAAELVERGLVWHDTPRAVAAAVDVVISMVADEQALADVTGGPDGIFAGVSSTTTYLDMSTVSPHTTRRIADQAQRLGTRMLDAPVSGSVPQVQQGTLAIMVGGELDTFHRVEPILRSLGTSVTHVGESGAGEVLKLAINISLAVQIVAFSEGLLLAERSGIDAGLAAEVMDSSAIGSPMLKARVPLMLDLPDNAWFTVENMHKDIRIALDEAHRLGIPLPSADVAHYVLDQARELGYADRDIASVRAVLTKLSTRK
jgi:3-hydroxyisobutyrate dehydrogenase-like beta-hydroxyacid dehydrogenase